MVSINKAYIKINNEKDKNIIEELLKEAFVNIEIKWDGCLAKFIVFQTDSFQLQLIKLVSLNLQDLGIAAKVLIIPFFNDIFIKYLDKTNHFVATAFEVFVNKINDKQTILDAGFDQVYSMLNLVKSVTYDEQILGTYIFNLTMKNSNIPFTVAMSVIQGVFALVLMLAGNALVKKKLGRSLW